MKYKVTLTQEINDAESIWTVNDKVWHTFYDGKREIDICPQGSDTPVDWVAAGPEVWAIMMAIWGEGPTEVGETKIWEDSELRAVMSRDYGVTL